MDNVVFIGYEPRELDAFLVARHSIYKHSPFTIVHGLVMSDMVKYGHYWRKTITENGQMYDEISEAPMSTQFAITRFLTPMLARNLGAKWALFIDCDVLIMEDLGELFSLADDKYAVMCVKHKHHDTKDKKMDNQIQTAYPRKNWSSVMLFNCKHESNLNLDVGLINSVPGRDLHAFCWLKDEEIGELPMEWNHLVGVDDPNPNAKIVHHTLGVPSMVGCENSEYAKEWKSELMEAIR